MNTMSVCISCMCCPRMSCIIVFFFNDTATTEIYTLSLHDALPICFGCGRFAGLDFFFVVPVRFQDSYFVRDSDAETSRDRKSTRLNSSHDQISYAVFCLKKKKSHNNRPCTFLNTL